MKIDGEIGGTRCPGRPPLLSDSELVCLAVAQALPGYHPEARWLRYANKHLTGMFPYLPQRPGCHKRLKAALPLLKRMIRELAMDSDFRTGTVWIAGSTPVPCGMSRPTTKRSNMAGWAGYAYCASRSRFFRGLRPCLVCAPTGMPTMRALANPKIGEREVLTAMLEVDADPVARREGILLITDKGFASEPFEKNLVTQGIELLRPSLKREKKRYGEPMLKKVRQLIEPVNDTLKGQLDLKRHGGRTFEGAAVRVTQRMLAIAAGIWHNNLTGAAVTRSLIAYDH